MEVGEIKRGCDIGKLPPFAKFVWVRCPDCGKERWRYKPHVRANEMRCCSCHARYIDSLRGFKAVNRISERLEQVIAARFKTGELAPKIARDYGLCEKTIYNVADRMGVA